MLGKRFHQAVVDVPGDTLYLCYEAIVLHTTSGEARCLSSLPAQGCLPPPSAFRVSPVMSVMPGLCGAAMALYCKNTAKYVEESDGAPLVAAPRDTPEGDNKGPPDSGNGGCPALPSKSDPSFEIPLPEKLGHAQNQEPVLFHIQGWVEVPQQPLWSALSAVRPSTFSSLTLSTMMDFMITAGRLLWVFIVSSSSQYFTSCISEFSSLSIAHSRQAILASPRQFAISGPSSTGQGVAKMWIVVRFVLSEGVQPGTRMPLCSNIKWGFQWSTWLLSS